jgi:hypothetical protein
VVGKESLLTFNTWRYEARSDSPTVDVLLQIDQLLLSTWDKDEVEDYIYRNGLLLAAQTPTETKHFLDHLGSVRVVTDGSGICQKYHGNGIGFMPVPRPRRSGL